MSTESTEIERIKQIEERLLAALGDSPSSINGLEAVAALRESLIVVLALLSEADASAMVDRFVANAPGMLARAGQLRDRIHSASTHKPN